MPPEPGGLAHQCLREFADGLEAAADHIAKACHRFLPCSIVWTVPTFRPIAAATLASRAIFGYLAHASTSLERLPDERVTDEYGLCVICGGHGSVMQGERTNAHGRVVPNLVPCPHCDQRDRITPMVEARADG